MCIRDSPQVGDDGEDKWMLESFLEYLNVPEGFHDVLPNLLRIFSLLAVTTLIISLFRKPNKTVQTTLSELEPYLQRAQNITKERHQGETVKRWAKRLKQNWPELEVLARLYEERYYRGHLITEKDRETLEKVLNDLKIRTKTLKKS